MEWVLLGLTQDTVGDCFGGVFVFNDATTLLIGGLLVAMNQLLPGCPVW